MGSENKDWVSEQEQLLMFDKTNGNGEAIRLLEHSKTNRDISSRQGQLFTVARFLQQATGFTFYSLLANECEQTQMNIDNTARHDFMKVAIDQWQGKIKASKSDIKATV